MVPFVPTITASLGNLKAEEKVSVAILLLENFMVTTTVSSAPVVAKSSRSAESTEQLSPVEKMNHIFYHLSRNRSP